MKRNFLFLLFLIILFPPIIQGQALQKTIIETEGNFSYSVPADWSVTKIEGMEYQMVQKKEAGFSPNMNFHRETNKYKFDEYIKLNIADMKQYVSNFSELKNEEFITDSKLKGKKFICSSTLGGKNLMQVIYFLEAKDKSKILITGSSLIEDREKYSPLFDGIVKSFKTTK